MKIVELNAWAAHKIICDDLDELRGFFDPATDIKCRQKVRHIIKKGKLIDKIVRAKNPPPLPRQPYDFHDHIKQTENIDEHNI
jgi:hypothetical protein